MTLVHVQPFDDWMIDPLTDYRGEPAGYRVRRVGSYLLEIHPMMFNLRLIVAEAMYPDLDDIRHLTGYGWCFPKEIGVLNLAAHAWAWDDFDVTEPGATNPPGPWIRAIHTGYYRRPGIGQQGPDGEWGPV